MATLWLVGMMGSGKSSVGPIVAASLDMAYYDTDAEVERKAGTPVSELLTHDEPGFRALERDVVVELAGSDAVVACGGGAILDEGSTTAMRESGLVVWLEAAPETLAARVGDDEQRPLLAGGSLTALRDLAVDRRLAYERAAHTMIVTDGRDLESVANEVVQAWNDA